MKKIIYLLNIFLSVVLYAQVSDSLKREVYLEGAINFRDAGGYKTTDGKRVKWDRIYRSEALNKLTSNDTIKLKRLRIKTVFDFRGPYEIARARDNLPKKVKWINLPQGSENIGNNMPDLSNEKKLDSLLITVYTDLSNMAKRYEPVFHELLTSDKPILYHCTAGKDRTGLATALILYTLGVPKSSIVEDYLASNYYRKPEINKVITVHTKDGIKTLPKIVKQVKVEWLEAIFDAIIHQYGSIDLYLNKEMGIGPKQIEILRKRLLE